MKKSILNMTIALLAGGLVLTGCKKEEPELTETPGTSASTALFTWKVNNATTVTADSSFCYPSITTIYAFKNGLNNSIEINLSSLNAGSYLISSSTGNALTYISGSSTLTASSGTVTITTDNNNKLSGNLSASFSGGTITSLSAQFSDLTRRN